VTNAATNPLLASLKVGFLGCGNMSQAMIAGLIKSQTLKPHHVFASNRSEGKLHKVQELYGVQICPNNEELVEGSDVVILGAKPQDLLQSIEPIASCFSQNQIVISLAAGLRLETLERYIPQVRWVRVMPNTPSLISKGIIGYMLNEPEDTLSTVIEDLMMPLGMVERVDDEDQFESLMIACSSGTGFIFELMMYWSDWLEERGFEPEIARRLTVQAFLGAAELAQFHKLTPLQDLQSRVASKKGITQAGLDSMQELEVERMIRVSFEKAHIKNQELFKSFK
jgi:pyrroline-5-carboxylate reductase